MSGALFLGWRYLVHHRLKSSILVASVTLMLFLPTATRLLVEDSAEALNARAAQTPLVLGAVGSELELALNTLYFHAETPPALKYKSLADADASELARFIPINARFHAQQAPIVGTNLEYFDFRGLSIATGRFMGLLGECVIGSGLAASRGLGAGDSILSSPETVFTIAGVYPLKMNIVGVLEPSGTPDDGAVFVDVRTTWIIEGLGHGHMDLENPAAGQSVLARNETSITANEALSQHAEITAENISEFHFHGSTDAFPLTGIIAVPPDQKNTALLRGRYQAENSDLQLIVPGNVLAKLMETVFTVQNYIILGLVILSLATIAVVTLVFLLSQQIRRGEFHTLSRIGASKGYISLLIASELGFVLVIGSILAGILTWFTRLYAMQILQSFLTL
jgi:putative ABC transport system permease protein